MNDEKRRMSAPSEVIDMGATEEKMSRQEVFALPLHMIRFTQSVIR